MIRRRWNEKDIPLTQMTNEYLATNMADKLYTKHSLHLVLVIRVDNKATLDCDRFNVVFQRERNCHHSNVQYRFNFNGSGILPKCEACNEEVRLTKVEEIKL